MNTLTAKEIERSGLIAIGRANREVDWLAAAQALLDGGIKLMEITLNTPSALKAISVIREKLSPVIRIGAGTVLSVGDAQAAFQAGAEFLVTPALQTDVVAASRSLGIPILCGCMTPTEALLAHQAGADFIKLFPADRLGPSYVRALLAPLPFLKIIPTGGVSAENLPEYIQAGCVGAGIGSSLLGEAMLHGHGGAAITEAAWSYAQALTAARAETQKTKR